MADDTEITTDLPDLTEVPLSDLLTLDNPHLAESLRRVVEEDERANVVAGFQSAI